MGGVSHIVFEGRSRRLEVSQICIGSVSLSLLDCGFKASHHVLHFLDVVNVVLSSRRLLSQSADVLVMLSCQEGIHSLLPQEVVDDLVSGISSQVKEIVNLCVLRDL